MKTTLVKAITLVSFFCLLGLFVAYRSGMFDHSSGTAISSDHNGSVLNTNAPDTSGTGQKADTPRREPYTIPSSKSLVLPENNRTTSNDSSGTDTVRRREPFMMPGSKSAPVLTPTQQSDTVRRREPFMMPGSKSAPVLTPQQQSTDTAKPPKPDTVRRRRVIMSGSKSAPVLEPARNADSSKP